MSGGGEGLGHENFLWENQSWAFSNSDKSAGSEGKLGKKLPGSSSSSQIEIGAKEGSATGKKKRGRGSVSKNGNGSTGGDQGKGEGKGGGESDHDIHIWTERERRKKMRNMFANLHALLPQLPPKADKSTIVDEAVSYIKTLHHTLQKLQQQKLERLQGGAASTFGFESPIMISQRLSNDSREAFLADQGSSNNLGAVTANNSSSNPLSASLRYPVNFETWTSSNVVLNICGEEAQISVCSSTKPGLLTTICYVLEKHRIEVVSAHINSDSNRSMYNIHARVSGASNHQFQEPVAFPVEEIYKQAAGEIMLWVS
ncbi:LOW QUALITY PROTEIN: transcription factor bHLH95-like [Juglans microcarpa x Juglans regia]|uniref:LOW QUALITY PROTEIN: transcription factor bHLH95-like n=1 Tax=Juglans microcarpa x Juglans regia TaxID=2249226 RepID=UPI001B7F1951|nr:LOW QUALITY PROTEIN: transcription factor bHLH95-like [Juglans microcarpa x Juglans regia]